MARIVLLFLLQALEIFHVYVAFCICLTLSVMCWVFNLTWNFGVLDPVPIQSTVNTHFIHVKMYKLFFTFANCFIMAFNIHQKFYISKTMIFLPILKMRHLRFKRWGHPCMSLGSNGSGPQNPGLQIPRSVLIHTFISHFLRLCLPIWKPLGLFLHVPKIS